MRILFQSNRLHLLENGPARFARLLHDHPQLLQEHEVRLLSDDIPPEKEGDYPKAYRMELKTPPGLSLLSQFQRNLRCQKKAKAIHQDWPFDLSVYNHALVGYWHMKKGPGPVLGMINDDNNMQAFSHYKPFSKAWIKRGVMGYLEQKAAHKAHLLIANSHFIKAQIMEHYKVEEQKIEVLYKAVDLSRAVDQVKTKLHSPIRITFVKSDFRRGGLLNLLRALGELPQYQWELRVIGFDEVYRKQIAQHIPQSTHLNVQLIGRMEQEELFKVLREQSDLFCVPAKLEALGVANMEAILHGVPVVSTSAGGIPEVCDGQKGAWLAKPNDLPSLKEQLLACVENEQARIERANHALSHLKQRFGLEEMMQRFVQICEKARTAHV